MEKYIYVFTEQDRDRLSSIGFRLLKGDSKPFIFANNQDLQVNFDDIKAVRSDVMQF